MISCIPWPRWAHPLMCSPTVIWNWDWWQCVMPYSHTESLRKKRWSTANASIQLLKTKFGDIPMWNIKSGKISGIYTRLIGIHSITCLQQTYYSGKDNPKTSKDNPVVDFDLCVDSVKRHALPLINPKPVTLKHHQISAFSYFFERSIETGLIGRTIWRHTQSI